MSFFEQLLDRWLRHMPRPAPPKPTPPPPGNGNDSWLTLLLTLHNHERARAGLRPYNRHDKLEACATRYATILAAYGRMDSSAHSVDGTSVGGRIAVQGYSWQRAGENVAAGQGSPEDVTAAWMSSPGHRQNILGPYPDVGFGYARTAQGTLYWCADFASPLGGRLLDQAIIVAGFDQELVWEPSGLYGPGNWDSTGREVIGL
jgi:uncharacterized protein YkwD